ncbi:MAG: ABC transporter ATP-binding protein [Syntrophomonadaceae bacterium]|nr:ABC transporter ATP-binding protein [Syntrophomonadaceae bacterium]MDD3022314.1 ABC transporter ATP-binding protein [Syntrophomonadaceae bacterium]
MTIISNEEKEERAIKNAVEIHNLRKVYKIGEQKVIALNDVSLNINAGEICCILGTSGSGKSTLLNLIAGLEKPSRGSILINGKRIEQMDENQLSLFRQKHIGFIFQSFNLLPAFSALENVSLPLAFRGMKKPERDRLAASILKSVGLKKHLKHKPSEMSGGQQQRVGIARAFVSSPPIILADEPTGNLDSKTSLEVMQLMMGLARDNQQTLIIVTHDSNIARFADQVVYFLDGNIEEIKFNYPEMEENINEA